MADRKGGAYGAPSSDTSFRKTWDKDEYAAKAAARKAEEQADSKARYEAAIQGKKYVKRASTPPDAKATEARTQRLDVSAQVGKQMIVSSASAVGKRGKGAGFYCDACDLTFKDNMQLVEHYNSRQHLVNSGESGEVKRATLDQVQDRILWLKRKREDRDREKFENLDDRLKMSAVKMEEEQAEKRRKRKERKQMKRDGTWIKPEDD